MNFGRGRPKRGPFVSRVSSLILVPGLDSGISHGNTTSVRPEAADIRGSCKANGNLAKLAEIRVGIGICQIGIARRDPDLVRLLPDVFELPLDTWIAMHENLKSSPRWRVTFDALVNGLLDYVRG